MVRLTDRPDMTLDVYRGRKTAIQQQQILPRLCNGVEYCDDIFVQLIIDS